jgi:hypothetical protein
MTELKCNIAQEKVEIQDKKPVTVPAIHTAVAAVANPNSEIAIAIAIAMEEEFILGRSNEL